MRTNFRISSWGNKINWKYSIKMKFIEWLFEAIAFWLKRSEMLLLACIRLRCSSCCLFFDSSLYLPSIRIWTKIFPDDSANISVTHKQPRITINEFDWKIYYKRSHTGLTACLLRLGYYSHMRNRHTVWSNSTVRNGNNKIPKSWKYSCPFFFTLWFFHRTNSIQ